MKRIEELRDLKKRARAIESRLEMLNKRIERLKSRIEAGDFKAVIDLNKCSGCGICADNCPVNAILVENKAHINHRLCKGCGLCASVCPRDAISLGRTLYQKPGIKRGEDSSQQKHEEILNAYI